MSFLLCAAARSGRYFHGCAPRPDGQRARPSSYIVEISENGENFVLAADCSDNEISGTVSNLLYNAKGRYVRITVLSCSQIKGYAVIHDMRLEGRLLAEGAMETGEEPVVVIIPEAEAPVREKDGSS